MKVLVTGGTGVIGEGLIPALLEARHSVRLLSRHADQDALDWGDAKVEGFPGDVADAGTLTGAADGCEAVVHIAGIARQSPPEQTFERINVEGTRNVVREAQRAGVRRFLFISSLGADTGGSEYHRSKREAEQIVAGFGDEWVILRPSAVYGPGDGVVSALLVLVRSLPALPVIGNGEQRFQPIWYEDLAAAIVRALKRNEVVGRTLEVAGAEVVSVNEIVQRLQRIEGRSTPRVPIPEALAELGTRVAEAVPIGDLLERMSGLDLPLDRSTFEMLREENYIRTPGGNAVTEVFNLTPLPLDEGLRRLARELPERLPEEGMGPMERRRFHAVIRDSDFGPEQLMEVFRRECADLLPMAIVDAPRDRAVEPGDTIELALEGRGNVSIRVEDVGPNHVTFATLQGHPLAGIVRFATTEEGEKLVRFTVEIHARPSGAYDMMLMAAGGDDRQRSTWEEAVRRVVERSGGTAPEGVVEDSTQLDGEAARAAERWVGRVVRSRRRQRNTARS